MFLKSLKCSDAEKINYYSALKRLFEYTYLEGKTFLVERKTKSSFRKILLSASTIAKLKKHRAVVLKEKLSQCEEPQDNDLVMCTPSGTFVIG